MPTLILSFPPPKNWQDFEQLTREVAKYRLAGEFDNYGRQGQKQSGIDIYGWDKDYKSTGIQCKHKSHTKTSETKIVTTITTKAIDVEIKLATNLPFKLDRYIIATTSFRDVNLQNHIHNINGKKRGKVFPKVELWTWESFEEEINNHSELSYVYFKTVLKNFDQYDKDKHILSLLKYSLSRPAFTTIFNSENNCEDFIKAISDTSSAFTTGKLYDRNNNLLSSAYPAKNLKDKRDRNDIVTIETLLQKIRDFTTNNLKKGNIIQQKDFLHFPRDWETRVSETLNTYRIEIIETMNKILKRNKFELINNILKRN